MNKIYIKLIIIAFFFMQLFSQENILQNIIRASKDINSIEQKNINRAKSHERAGLIKEADLIYQQLFKDNPSSREIFSSYKIFLKKQENI